MRYFFYLIIVLGLFGFSYLYKLPNVCDKGVSYTIGQIDPRFNLSREQVLQDIQEAEHYWETATGLDLFTHNPNAEKPLTIQMVYDERQAISSEVNTEKSAVNQDKSTLQSRIEDFKRRSDELDRKVQAFNDKVGSWNKSSSQTEEEYNKLVSEQSELEQLTRQVNAEARTLQLTTNDINTKIDKLNGNITTLQTVVKAKPEEGLYESASKTISIYYNNSQQELIHTIEHELGHGLGLDHLKNPVSVMYVQSNDTLVPTSDDVNAVHLICKKETIIDRLLAKQLQMNLMRRFNGIL